jgi:hypothetical protein
VVPVARRERTPRLDTRPGSSNDFTAGPVKRQLALSRPRARRQSSAQLFSSVPS